MLSSSSLTPSRVSTRGTGVSRCTGVHTAITTTTRSRTALQATWMDDAIAKANASVNLKKGKDSKKMSGFRYDGSMMRWVRRVHACLHGTRGTPGA